MKTRKQGYTKQPLSSANIGNGTYSSRDQRWRLRRNEIHVINDDNLIHFDIHFVWTFRSFRSDIRSDPIFIPIQYSFRFDIRFVHSDPIFVPIRYSFRFDIRFVHSDPIFVPIRYSFWFLRCLSSLIAVTISSRFTLITWISFRINHHRWSRGFQFFSIVNITNYYSTLASYN